MYRLFSLSALLIVVSCDPRSPKIYNVLISSKKNLSPSHAVPVFEPVLRTTYALPPLLYPPPFGPYPLFGPNYVARRAAIKIGNDAPNGEIQGQMLNDQQIQQQSRFQQSLPALQQFIPYAYTPQILNNQGYYSMINQPERVNNRSEPNPNGQLYQKSDDPKNIVANLKRNPDIRDVPPPALPGRTKT